jgi:hypothetical protein
MGKIGARLSGPIGFIVAGLRGGIGLFGISATILYQCLGISLSLKIIFLIFSIIGKY